MPLLAQDWYNANAACSYPIQDSASGVADDGSRLPNDILVDANLRFPATLGSYAYLASCLVTPRLVSLVFFASSSPTAAVQVAPLCAVALAQPVEAGRLYPVSPLASGVGGWIVLGEGVSRAQYHGRFSSPAQTLLLPRVAQPHPAPQVLDFGKFQADPPMTGVIRLSGGGDIEIVSGCRALSSPPQPAASGCVSGEVRAAIIRIKDRGGPGNSAYATYLGPCDKRPESTNCGDPQPIESINGVTPDCCGNITIRFYGPVDVGRVVAERYVDDYGANVDLPTCGIVISTMITLYPSSIGPFSLSSGLFSRDYVCVDGRLLPDQSGRLPDEAEDYCSISYVSLSF